MKLKKAVPILMSLAMIFVGLIHFLTGVAPIFRQAAENDLGITAQYFFITDATKTSDIVSLLLGSILVGLGIGLYHKRQKAWYIAFFIMVFAVINSIYGRFEIQNFISSSVYVFLMLIFKDFFKEPSPQRMTYTQIISWLSIIFAVGYGAIGSYLMRDQFTGVHNWIDAIYFTLVTYSTLGYGDATPQTNDAKLFVISMILIGVSTFVAAISMLIGPMIENRIKGVLNIMHKLRNFSGHVIICGFNPMSLYAAHLIKEQEKMVLFISKSPEEKAQLEQLGFTVLLGDATQEDTLHSANIKKANSLISAFESDADNILTVMTAAAIRNTFKESQPLKIITRIDQKQNIEKAKRIGADKVITPAILGGKRMAEGII